MISVNKFKKLINDATNSELYEYLSILTREIELSNTAIKEGMEEQK